MFCPRVEEWSPAPSLACRTASAGTVFNVSLTATTGKWMCKFKPGTMYNLIIFAGYNNWNCQVKPVVGKWLSVPGEGVALVNPPPPFEIAAVIHLAH
jgi:hypothetical protein